MTSTLTSKRTVALHLVTDETAPRSVGASVAGLTEGMRAGSDAAWAEFHGRYYLPLLRYAAVCTGEASDAGEIVQLAYLRIARHIKLFTDEVEFWRWLSCVVRCTAVDQRRGMARRTALLEKFAHWQDLKRHGATAGQPELPGEALAQEALMKLAEEDARLLRLKYYEGWSVEQLAAGANTTPKSMENRLARLRQRLREIISRMQ